MINNDLLLTLLSGAPSIPGLWILHRAFRGDSVERRDIGSWKGIALLLAGLCLVAIPLVIWCGALLHRDHQGPRHVSPASVFLLAGYLDVAFFWFLWNVKSFALPIASPGGSQWEENWGATYSPELKKRLLGPVLDQLDQERKIGNRIVDIGSGAHPVSKFLPAAPDRNFILLDIAGHNLRTPESLSIRFDAGHVTRPDLFSYRKAWIRVCQFVGHDPRSPVRTGRATTMVFSDILNYIDFRNVLPRFADFLEPGGRIIIVNLPGRGVREQFSEQGLKSNEDLYPLLRNHGFEIESKEFPCRPKDTIDESEEMIVLVARKAR